MSANAKPLPQGRTDAASERRSDAAMGFVAVVFILLAVGGYLMLSARDRRPVVDAGGFASKEEQEAALAQGFTSATSWEAKKLLDNAMAKHKAELEQQAFARQITDIQIAEARERMHLQEILQPAPAGKPKDVAVAVLMATVTAGDCPAVKSAKRKPDGSIVAVCSNGGKYLVYNSAEEGDTAMECSAVIKSSTLSC